MTAIRILFLASSPDDRARLRLDEEARAIQQRIRSSEHRDAIQVITQWAVRTGDLQETLLRHRPHIVHFSGHGTTKGILLQGNDGKAKLVSGAALAHVLGTLADGIRVVVFNACSTDGQARAMTVHVDVAIGMRQAMGDAAAITFASAFYMGLGYGRSVKQAFDIGVGEILIEGIPHEDRPTILHRDGVDPSAIVMAGPGAPAPSPTSAPASSNPSTPPAPPPSNRPSNPPLNLPPDLPRALLDQLEPLREKLHSSKNAVVPFVGSGLSMPLLPSWSSFLKSLFGQAALQKELEQALDEGRYLRVASLLERDPNVGKPMISQAIEREFRRPGRPRPEVYDLVARLPTKHFLTTNYDPWLKEAVSMETLRNNAGIPRVYIPDDVSSLADLDPGSAPLVLMLHGDADRAEHCVLSTLAYRKLQHGMPAFKSALSAMASQRTFLFMGYSLSDPDIASVLDERAEIFTSGGAAPRHYILGAGLSVGDTMELHDRGVQPVDYSPNDPRDHRLLPAILRWLA